MPRILRALFIFSLFVLAACGQGASVDERVAAAKARYDGPALFKAESPAGGVLYLYGTVHFLDNETDWQRRDLLAAFDEVGTVFFEVPDDAKAGLEAASLQRELGRYESGQTLSGQISNAALNYFTAAVYNLNMKPETFDGFRPWLVSDMLTIAAAESAGLYATNSADTALRRLADTKSKRVLYLDDMSTYIKAIAAQPEPVQLRAFAESMKHMDELPSNMKAINRAWLVGDIAKLEREVLAPAKAKSPEIYDALFTQRNAKWEARLSAFLDTGLKGIAIVGVGHLIGEDGLPERLRNRGYDVTRVRRFDLPNTE